MKSTTLYPITDTPELRCPKCHRALEVSVTEEDGELKEYLQCWHCFSSIPLHTMRIPIHKLGPEMATFH